MKSITTIFVMFIVVATIPITANLMYPLCVALMCTAPLVGVAMTCPAALLFCVLSCFSPYEQVLMADKTYKNIADVVKGDKIYTNTNDGMYTTVISNRRIEGDFDFKQFTLSDDDNRTKLFTIAVTSNHVMIVIGNVLDPMSAGVKVASDINIGDVMTSDCLSHITVINIKSFKLKEKYTLVTENGLAAVSGVLTSTICSDTIVDNNYNLTMKSWRSVHKFY